MNNKNHPTSIDETDQWITEDIIGKNTRTTEHIKQIRTEKLPEAILADQKRPIHPVIAKLAPEHSKWYLRLTVFVAA